MGKLEVFQVFLDNFLKIIENIQIDIIIICRYTATEPI